MALGNQLGNNQEEVDKGWNAKEFKARKEKEAAERASKNRGRELK